MVFKPMLAAALLACSVTVAAAQEAVQTPVTPTDAQIEEFLLRAKVVRTRSISKGITGSRRATLSDGTMTHDAQIQAVDEYQTRYEGAKGVELNFRDSWSYNVAAYKLDRLLGLNFVPVSVARVYNGKKAAFTWWIDDVQMDERERLAKKVHVPDPEAWNQQMFMLRVFDQLIGNTDRNLGNLLITRDWRLHAIDHTRAFRLALAVEASNLTRCDRQLFERIRALDKRAVDAALGKYMFTNETAALMARRDEIVKILEKAGPSALFNR